MKQKQKQRTCHVPCFTIHVGKKKFIPLRINLSNQTLYLFHELTSLPNESFPPPSSKEKVKGVLSSASGTPSILSLVILVLHQKFSPFKGCQLSENVYPVSTTEPLGRFLFELYKVAGSSIRSLLFLSVTREFTKSSLVHTYLKHVKGEEQQIFR